MRGPQIQESFPDNYPGHPPYDADFTPFGGERTVINNINTCNLNYKFEGKERDTETGNDDFGARYYSNRLGRWLSSDWSAVPVPVPYANLTNPQTLNLYSMVADDPESFADLDGHTQNSSAQVLLPNYFAVTPDVAAAGRAYEAFCTNHPESCPDSTATQQQDKAQNQSQDQNQQNNQQSTTQQPAPQSGINPNYKLPTLDTVLKNVSDFSAGAGDCLTGRCIPFVHTSLTEWARGSADSVVDKSSLAYKGGEVTGGIVGTALLSAGGATAAAVADGKNGALFGRGLNTVFNSSKVRFGWGWQGSATAGRDVIRLGIGAARGTNWWSHIVFWVPKP